MFEAFGSKVFCYKVSLPEVIPIDPQWQREQTRERGGKRVGGVFRGQGSVPLGEMGDQMECGADGKCKLAEKLCHNSFQLKHITVQPPST